jgi:DNA-binding NtrC family response regulator
MARPVRFTADAFEIARRHGWPGNVRALRNAITRAAARSDGPIGARELLPGARFDAEPEPEPVIAIPRGDYRSMNRALLHRVVAEEGSIRKAARVLKVPRSTLGNWLKRS